MLNVNHEAIDDLIKSIKDIYNFLDACDDICLDCCFGTDYKKCGGCMLWYIVNDAEKLLQRKNK